MKGAGGLEDRAVWRFDSSVGSVGFLTAPGEPLPLTRAEFSADHPRAVRERLHAIYGEDIGIQSADAAAPIRYHHVRHASAGFQVDQVTHSGTTTLTAEQRREDVALWVHAGTVLYRSGQDCAEAGRGDLRLVTAGRRPVSVEFTTARVTAIHLQGAHPRSAGRAGWLAPRTQATSEMLKRTISYVTDVLESDDRRAAESMVDALAALLRAATLAGFHTDTDDHTVPLPTETFPETLRTVLAYIDANAGRGISIADLAAKAFATPRTIQYLFRRHLGTTPSAHLRRVRLAKARQELILADRSTTTVTATATRWGFGHTGRFAVLYREVYGESPHQTLARRGARSGDRGVVGVEHPVAKAGQ